jgi:hypothetical protein
VPARLGPVGPAIDRDMGYDTLFLMLVMPYAAVGPPDRAVDRDRPAIRGPWVNQGDQTAASTAGLCWQRVQQDFQLPLPGPLG